MTLTDAQLTGWVWIAFLGSAGFAAWRCDDKPSIIKALGAGIFAFAGFFFVMAAIAGMVRK